MHADGANATRSDGRGHSSTCLTMSKKAMTSVSKKLGLVTTSSTETEVVADGERFPKCAWFRCFRLAPGDEAKEDILMQDNQSCMLLHKNHPFSVGKRSKHVNVRHFFVVDKIDKKEVKMVADCSSKPLQAKIFVVHRNTMLGISAEECEMRKQWHKEALERCELWDDLEGDLNEL